MSPVSSDLMSKYQSPVSVHMSDLHAQGSDSIHIVIVSVCIVLLYIWQFSDSCF